LLIKTALKFAASPAVDGHKSEIPQVLHLPERKGEVHLPDHPLGTEAAATE
jgi:hypothetical protein